MSLNNTWRLISFPLVSHHLNELVMITLSSVNMDPTNVLEIEFKVVFCPEFQIKIRYEIDSFLFNIHQIYLFHY